MCSLQQPRTVPDTVISRGFTLIEMVISLAIVSVLSALTLAGFHAYVARAEMVEPLTLSTAVQLRIVEHFEQTGSFPENNGAVGMGEPSTLAGRYTGAIEVENGAIHLTLADSERVNFFIRGKRLSLRPVRVGGNGVKWICGNAPIPGDAEPEGVNRTDVSDMFLPVSCR